LRLVASLRSCGRSGWLGLGGSWLGIGFEAGTPLHKNQAKDCGKYYEQDQLTQPAACRLVFQQIFDFTIGLLL
jgi:predicted RNA-binding protein with PUA domain